MHAEVEVRYLSEGVKEFNEDTIGMTDYAWWVIDGSHVGVRLTPNDATWFVTTLSKYITELIDRFNLNLKVVLERALFKTTIDHEILKKKECINEREYLNPTAVIGVIRFNPIKGKIEIYKLGDVSIYYKYSGKEKVIEKELVGDERIDKFEQYFIDKIQEYVKKHGDYGKARRELISDIYEVRRRYLNTEDGYYSLEPGREDIISEGTLIEIPHDDMKFFEAMILSDGMYKIIDPFKRFKNMKDLAMFVRTAGFKQVYKMITFFSYSDQELKKYRRVKVLDDASGIHLLITRLSD